ncbi:hypothetical protein [Halomontanus rarus]|uniref:hypothetical protein n=1 Tax=Halomontanus rarus TaxID=3034020 RepID=UPI0023E7985B|nr:hypothetical protein [Halovivax sp. TS33]
MTDDTQKAEELLQQSKEQKRHETEPTEAEPDPDDTQSLEDAVCAAYWRLENDEMPSNLTLRDRNLAALFAGLEESGELVEVGEAAAEKLDRDDDVESRADVLRLLLRSALADIDESVLESAKEGHTQFAVEQAESEH